MELEFEDFPKMGRLFREVVITEKIDGTNAQVCIGDDGEFQVGSRTRWITPDNDNFGFAAWAYDNKEELLKLGPGRHFGEWWGVGIQRKYSIGERRFSLFNTLRWNKDNIPSCCHVVPELYRGPFEETHIHYLRDQMEENGSAASPGFMQPEGIIIFHTHARVGFKYTFDGDGHKGERK